MTTPLDTPSIELDQPPKDALEGLLWWIVGGAIGTALTVVVGLIALVALSGETASSSTPVATSPPPVAGSARLVLVATEFAFDPADAVVAPTLEITLENQGLVLHNVEIEGVVGFVIEAQAGQSATGSIELEPGTYQIFCSIPGHREAGMVGALAVGG